MPQRIYIAIDLKSFYASVECVERGLDPMETNLVVADIRRTEKTICLAVSPTLKAYGIPGRARLFEVIQKVREVNEQRRRSAPGHTFSGASSHDPEVQASPSLALDYLVAPPRMALYMEYSARIYQIYLKYAAPEDIHPYSIDEIFMDATAYLETYHCSAKELARRMILDVLQTTGITAAAGVGTNLYLCKVALDIEAKHVEPDENGVRIAELDELTYRRKLWAYRPITDFWRVGRGYAKRLEACGIYTMGDIARCSIGRPEEYHNEDLLYRLLGVNAELLIDHAWGWESCTMADIKAYRPASNSVGSGQVLQCPYTAEKARLVVREMADMLALDLVDKGLVTDQIVLTVGYDIENLSGSTGQKNYQGEIKKDRYGRSVPKPAHGSFNLPRKTASTKKITQAVLDLYDRIVDPSLLVRRLNLTAARVVDEAAAAGEPVFEQIDLFSDTAARQKEREAEVADLARERKVQQTVLDIKRKFGKNAILRGMDFEEGATTAERNRQIGGHQA